MRCPGSALGEGTAPKATAGIGKRARFVSTNQMQSDSRKKRAAVRPAMVPVREAGRFTESGKSVQWTEKMGLVATIGNNAQA